MVNEFTRYYENLLGSYTECEEIDWDIIRAGPLINQEQADLITQPVSMQEIKAALDGIGDSKAPGPDGTLSFEKISGT